MSEWRHVIVDSSQSPRRHKAVDQKNVGDTLPLVMVEDVVTDIDALRRQTTRRRSSHL